MQQNGDSLLLFLMTLKILLHGLILIIDNKKNGNKNLFPLMTGNHGEV
jgi:hypothetical protein